MRWCLSILCCLAVFGDQLNAQEALATKSGSGADHAEAPPIIYQVDVIEFALKDKSDADLESANLLDLLRTKSDKIQRIESTRMTAIAGCKSTASFGRSSSVTMGVTKSAVGSTRNTAQIQIGTMLQLTPMNNSNGTATVTLSYEAARLTEAKQEDTMPDIVKVTVNAELMLKLGTPTLVAGSTNGDSSYIAITIREDQ
jgi:hypothetical protein